MDIDVDFEFELRENVIDYCKQKYGEQCVSRIITFGTMAAKGAVLDMARVLDYPVAIARKINEMIPSEPKMTIKKAMLQNVELNTLYNSDVDVHKIMDLAMKVEGLIKNTSCHACGVIIAPDDVTKFCPQTFALDEDTGKYERTTQYTMGECEEIGLLKMDFLGLRTESVIKEAINDIKTYHGIELNHYDVNSIPMNDINVYRNLLAKGKTAGVFQLESAGITATIESLYQDIEDKVMEIESNPLLTEDGKEEAKIALGNQCFERLIAGISLYRPGPMDEIPNYINGMMDESKIHYDCPQLEPILKNTYGVIVYQEQVMLAVRALAGFTAGQSDTIRKAMGKKKQEILDEFKPYFINGSGNAIDSHSNTPYNIKGCVDNGIDEIVAETIWGKMDSFAKYAFNKSHAAAYAVVAIQTAWLAYYYPTIFLKANLNVYKGNPDKLRFYLGCCGKAGIKVLPPSVNDSDFYFTLNDDASAIVFGLSGIKNVGKFAKSILRERNARGKFASFQDFLDRMLRYESLNSRAVESLAKVGAFDCFGGTRLSKVDNLGDIIEVVKSDKGIENPGQNTIYDLGNELNFSSDITELKDIEIPNDSIEYPKDEYLSLEEEFAGFYLSGHPLNDYDKILKTKNFDDIATIISKEDTKNTIQFAGLISEVTKKLSKNGNSFVTLKLGDATAEIKAVAFSSTLDSYGEYIQDGGKVIVSGRLSKNDFGLQFTINSVISLDEVNKTTTGLNLIASEDIEEARTQYQKAYKLCDAYSKSITNPNNVLTMSFCKNLDTFPLSSCEWSLQLLSDLRDIFKEDNIKLNTTLLN